MSAETLQAIENAISAHIASMGSEDSVVGDWFVSYSYMSHDPMADDGVSHTTGYAASDSAPHETLGVAKVGLMWLERDIAESWEEE